MILMRGEVSPNGLQMHEAQFLANQLGLYYTSDAHHEHVLAFNHNPSKFNFDQLPSVDRGPYDYHLATEEELFDGFPEDRPKSAASAKIQEEAPEAVSAVADDDESDAETSDEEE